MPLTAKVLEPHEGLRLQSGPGRDLIFKVTGEYLPSGVPHAFLNLTDDPGEIVVVYTPGGGQRCSQGEAS